MIPLSKTQPATPRCLLELYIRRYADDAMINPALVLTTVNAPYSKTVERAELVHSLLDYEAAKTMPGHMSSFFGDVTPELQLAFADLFGIGSAQLAGGDYASIEDNRNLNPEFVNNAILATGDPIAICHSCQNRNRASKKNIANRVDCRSLHPRKFGVISLGT